jgi:hypothetical protein
MLDNYSNSYVRAYSLGIAAKTKIMRGSSLLFISLWFGIVFIYAAVFRKIQDRIM